LTAELFDNVALDKMKEAEQAVHKAAVDIPPEICTRLNAADELSDEDRKQIVNIVRQALVPFQPKPESKNETPEKLDPSSKIETEDKSKPDGDTRQEAPEDTKPKAETKVTQ
jgi:F-type H+-transporting ATPase subunit alpha